MPDSVPRSRDTEYLGLGHVFEDFSNFYAPHPLTVHHYPE